MNVVIKKPSEIRSILIINLGGIGDFLLSTPALKALRAYFPQAEISVLISAKIYNLIEGLSYIDNALIFNIGYGGGIPFNKFLINFRTLLVLRRKKFDLAINMRTITSKRSAKKIKFLLDIIHPKIKVGRDTQGRGFFFDIRIPESDAGQKYEAEYDMELVEALGAEVINKSIDFEVDEESKRKINKILKAEGIAKETTIIGIHPGGMPARRWGIKNFLKAIEMIYKKIPCNFVITGGKEEIKLANKLSVKKDIKIINIAGKLNLKELFALIGRCDLFISNDTGPMHIAAILKIPLVALFGSGDIVRYDPRNISDKAAVLYKKIECSPCNKVTCISMRCLKVISPEDAIGAALKLLEANNKNA